MAQQTIKSYFTVLSLLHLAMLAGQIIFVMVALVLNAQGLVEKNELEGVLQIICPALTVGALAGSTVLQKIRMKAIQQQPNIHRQLADYRASLIVRLAMLEFPSLLSSASYLLTGNYLFLGLAGLVVVFFLMNRPSRATLANDLNLSEEVRAFINNEESVIHSVHSEFEE